MDLAFTIKSPVRSILWGVARPSLFRHISLVLLGVLLIAIGAKISIPIQPVPVTLQSLAVLLISMTYGLRWGVITVLIYVAAGFAGLPVLASASINLTAGYLIGFVFAATFTGFLAERGWACHVFSTLIAALIGTATILICGWGVLAHYLGASTAFDEGVKPFFLGGTLKIIVLALVVPAFWRSAGKIKTEETETQTAS